MMIHLMSKQVVNFPNLSKETLRRLIVSFPEQKHSGIKCQILNLAYSVYANRELLDQSRSEEETKSNPDCAVSEIMFKYVLKIACMDENLIVK